MKIENDKAYWAKIRRHRVIVRIEHRSLPTSGYGTGWHGIVVKTGQHVLIKRSCQILAPATPDEIQVAERLREAIQAEKIWYRKI